MIKPDKYIAEIKAVKQETEDIKTITVKVDKKFDFIQGQFVMVSIDGVNTEKGHPIKKAYSIASAPKKDLEFCIKIEKHPSFTREQINKWKVGQKFNIQGPFGNFLLKEVDDLVFIAAGTGIAPFMSMLRYVKNKNIALFYSIKTEQEYLYKKELESFNIKRIINLTREKKQGFLNGRLNKETLKKNINKKSEFYICGPAEFIKDIRNNLLELSIAKENIHVDLWG